MYKIKTIQMIMISLITTILLACSPNDSMGTGGDLPNPNIDLSPLETAVVSAELLLANSAEGGGEGEYPAQALAELQTAVESAESWMEGNLASADQNDVDARVEALYDACVTLESRVNSLYNELIDPHATRETRYLYAHLRAMAPSSLLFGMHDATGYGVGWTGDNQRSDVKDVCGAYPAVFSWDVMGILESDDLSDETERIMLGYNEGGVTTLCWHHRDPENNSFYYENAQYNVVQTLLPGGRHHDYYRNTLHEVSRYVKTLRGDRGESVPIIFRPFHEQNGTWFWWGRTRCSEAEYVQIWQFTVTYLRDSLNVHNFIYAFSPDGNKYSSKSSYLREYPGDDYTDILGLDFYFGVGDQAEIDRFQQRVKYAVQHAQEKGKLPALTECGDSKGWDDTSNLEIERWYTEFLLAPLKGDETAKLVSYAAVWRNAHENHHFAPYPGHPAAWDFIQFYNDPFTIFADGMPDVYRRP